MLIKDLDPVGYQLNKKKVIFKSSCALVLVYNITLLSGCGKFPSIERSEKQIIKDVMVNSSYKIEISVKYVCNDGYYYNLNNPIVNCENGVFDNDFGECVRGKKF